jgi:hypothetical protein
LVGAGSAALMATKHLPFAVTNHQPLWLAAPARGEPSSPAAGCRCRRLLALCLSLGETERS